jgi:hypothetical protein
MRVRGVILLVFAAAVLVQQLPIEPALWGEPPACCALARYCLMSARPGQQPRVEPSHAAQGAQSCVIQAACPTGRHDTNGAVSPNAQARPAVLEDSGWTHGLAAESTASLLERRYLSSLGESPPTPPPRSLFV